MRIKKLVIVLFATLAMTAGCGNDDQDLTSTSGTASDAAFITDMTAHHWEAIEMAQLAQKRSEDPKVRKLGMEITRAQGGEIAEMKRVRADMRGRGMRDGGHMRMSRMEMGMDMDMGSLRRAMPFDPAFRDMMIRHHEGATRMARRQIAEGNHPALRAMARDMLRTQGREIEQMRRWCRTGCGPATGSR